MLELITKAPSEAWVGLIGVVIGALLSLLGSWITSSSTIKQLKIQLSHSDRKEIERSKNEKLEELYILTTHWANKLFGNYLNLTLVMKGQSDYNTYLDKIISQNPSEYDFSRIQMIIDIYGKELKDEYAKILALRDKWNKIESAHKNAYKSGELEASRFLVPSAEIQLNIEKAVSDFKKKIASLVSHA